MKHNTIWNKLKKKLKANKRLYRFLLSFNLYLLRLMSVFVPDEIYVKWQYKNFFGRKLDLENPKSFNEKIQWLKLNWRDEILTICSDKYKVREYVKSRLGEKVLTKLYGVYDRVEDIIVKDLPDSFVLKVTHGSGQNIFCKNKNDVDWNHTFEMLKIYMANNHYYLGRESSYKNVIPRIICEEYLNEDGRSPIDYKFYCFDGQPLFINVHFDRFGEHKSNLYDINFNFLPVKWTKPNFLGNFHKPQCFDEMTFVAKRLAEGMIFVRVDLYCVNNKIYFGEMTFYPCNGLDIYIPDSYDYLLGSYLKLPLTKTS
ncbi:MAG: ATP-grasp fold amidoligase family protein [Candidatus Paceibacterota bacterium]